MKKIFCFISIIAGILSFSSCDDMLEVQPQSKLTPDQFFKSASEMEMFSMNFYGMFPASSLFLETTDHYTQSTLTDEMRGGANRTVPASGGGWSWGALRNVNTLLDYKDNCKDVAVRVSYEAVARFFRAYFYFEKVKSFGDVPWYESQVDATDEVQLNRPRDSREFIMQKMIEDIDYAIANLSVTPDVYRVTKYTALALKCRFCLFEGTFRKYHAGDASLATLPADAKSYKWYLQQASSAAKALMDSGAYGVYEIGGANSADSSYYRLFTTNNATDISKEVILARNYSLAFGVYHNSTYNMNTATGAGAPGMTKKLVASYLMNNGDRFTDKAGWETMQFLDEVKNRDKRLYQSIRTPGYKRIGDDALVAPEISCSVTGYQPVKYVGPKDQDKWNGSDNDLIIYRYGEVLLNYAEAKAEEGTLTQDDLDISVNLLRDRVGMPHLTILGLTVDPFLVNADWGGYTNPILLADPNEAVILEIRRERGVELCQEGHRYYDVVRWKEGQAFAKPFYGMYFPGKGKYDLNGDGKDDYEIKDDETAEKLLSGGKNGGFLYPNKENDSSVPRTWDEVRDYLYPIPSNERSLTLGALTQNPGWDDGLDF